MSIIERLRNHALPDPHDEREVMHAPLLREAADEIERLRKAIGTVCEGWTLPPGARKVLESALWADVTPNGEVRGASVTAQPACEASASTVVLEPTAKDE